MTRAGVILGTAAYMSPEQARGLPLDKRTDIWSFGRLLHEMLAGRLPFAGDSAPDVLASILAREPDFAALPPTVPVSILRMLRRCLMKDRNQRQRDIGDVKLDIDDTLASPNALPDAGPLAVVPRSRERILWIGTTAALLLLAIWSSIRTIQPAPIAPQMRADIVTPASSEPRSFAISPDGGTLAFVAEADGQSRLWLRSLESSASRSLPGTELAESPFWSPDSQSIGFFAGGKLRRVDVSTGSVQGVSTVTSGTGGTWNSAGVILFASLGNPIARVSASGGEPVPLTGLTQQGSDFAPSFLPDGRHFLYYVGGNPEVRGVYLGDLQQRTTARRLLDADTAAVYASSGHLLFTLQGRLFARPFDVPRIRCCVSRTPLCCRSARIVAAC
jgi:hypothetical protein